MRTASAVLAMITLSSVTSAVVPATTAVAQNPQMADKLQEVKQASAANKAALAHYIWNEQQTISRLNPAARRNVLFHESLNRPCPRDAALAG